MNMMTRLALLIIFLVILAFPVSVCAGYKNQPLPNIPPEDCPSFQHSQGLTIGAVPYIGKGKAKKLFDTKDLHKSGIVPILLIFRNENPYSIQVGARGIFFLDRHGQRDATIPYENIVAAFLQGKEVRVIGAPTIDLSTIKTGKKADMIQDFRQKSLQIETIPPGQTIGKVVFFRIGTDPKTIRGTHIYISEIFREDTGEELIFFEFECKLPPEPK